MKNTSKKIKLYQAFTLIELLVVVAIIAILTGFIVPTYFGVREHARRAKARATVKNLETAFREYYNYYRVWPESGAGVYEIKDALYDKMRGDNPHKRAFFDFETHDEVPDKMAFDPWKRDVADPWRAYKVQFDHDFNNEITHGGDTIYRSVIVWSVGPDGVCYTDDPNTDDDIRSWK